MVVETEGERWGETQGTSLTQMERVRERPTDRHGKRPQKRGGEKGRRREKVGDTPPQVPPGPLP